MNSSLSHAPVYFLLCTYTTSSAYLIEQYKNVKSLCISIFLRQFAPGEQNRHVKIFSIQDHKSMQRRYSTDICVRKGEKKMQRGELWYVCIACPRETMISFHLLTYVQVRIHHSGTVDRRVCNTTVYVRDYVIPRVCDCQWKRMRIWDTPEWTREMMMMMIMMIMMMVVCR